jgi:hypothetical protein
MNTKGGIEFVTPCTDADKYEVPSLVYKDTAMTGIETLLNTYGKRHSEGRYGGIVTKERTPTQLHDLLAVSHSSMNRYIPSNPSYPVAGSVG